MDEHQLADLQRRVTDFAAAAASMTEMEAEGEVETILRNLLAIDGYHVDGGALREEGRVDFAAVNESTFAPLVLGIEYKHLGSPVGASAIRGLLGFGNRDDLNFDRIMVVSRSGFTRQALALSTELPIEVELLGIPDLVGWVARLIKARRPEGSRVASAVLAAAREFARAVAENPAALDDLEWRDMERMLAIVLRDLGFEAELTPSAKDGGKDIVLRLCDRKDGRSYAVEVKHWRSNQHVGQGYISDFVQVVAREGHDRGLFLATYGYTQDAFAALSEIQRHKVQFGRDTKIHSLCRTFVKAEHGLWTPPPGDALVEVLFEGTQVAPGGVRGSE